MEPKFPSLIMSKTLSNFLLVFLVSKLWMMLVLCPVGLAATVPLSTELRDPPCTGSYNWLSPRMTAPDCIAAINKFSDLEVLRHGHREFEFLAVPFIHKTRLPKMQTPRRYTAGKATPIRSPERR